MCSSDLAHIKYEAPVPIGTLLRVGVDSRLENPRRIRHVFEMWDDLDGRRVANGFVRVGCVNLADFSPRDFPTEMVEFVDRIRALAAAQGTSTAELPWA